MRLSRWEEKTLTLDKHFIPLKIITSVMLRYTQQIPEQKIYWKIFYHKFTDQVDHKFMENLTKNI